MQPKPFLVKTSPTLKYNKDWYVIIWTTTEDLAKSYATTVVNEYFKDRVVMYTECLGIADKDAQAALKDCTYYGTKKKEGSYVHS